VAAAGRGRLGQRRHGHHLTAGLAVSAGTIGLGHESSLSLFYARARQAQRDEHVEALAQLEQGLAIFQLIGNRRSEGLALANLGSLHRWWGRNEEALAVYRAALAIHQGFPSAYVEGQTLCSLGDLLRELGRLEEARESLERALSLLREAPIDRGAGGAGADAGSAAALRRNASPCYGG